MMRILVCAGLALPLLGPVVAWTSGTDIAGANAGGKLADNSAEFVRAGVWPLSDHDDNCGAVQRLRRIATLPVECGAHVGLVPVNEPGPTSSAHTASVFRGSGEAESLLFDTTATGAAQSWPDMPIGTTDGFRAEAVGVSRRLGLHRRRRSKRAHRKPRHSSDSDANSDTEAMWQRDVAINAMMGFCIGVNWPSTCATWAFASIIVGLCLLAANRHFPMTTCTIISANYWCASAWIACVVSPYLGFALATVAVILRGSLLLFPDKADSEVSAPPAWACDCVCVCVCDCVCVCVCVWVCVLAGGRFLERVGAGGWLGERVPGS
jgi:hypothetical protein